jgi:hypothetical protein
MSYETKIFLLVLASSFALAAGLLYIQDYFYTARTGKPASERVREKMERSKRAYTTGQYFFLLISNSIVFSAALVWLLTDSRSWRRVTPIAYMLFGVSGLFNLYLRRRKERRNVTASADAAQLSGGAR